MARRFAKAYPVVLLSRSPATFDPIVQEIKANGGQAVGISTDLSDSKSVQAAFAQISQQFADAKLAAAVFNPAGGFVKKPFLELTEEDYLHGFESQGYVHIAS